MAGRLAAAVSAVRFGVPTAAVVAFPGAAARLAATAVLAESPEKGEPDSPSGG